MDYLCSPAELVNLRYPDIDQLRREMGVWDQASWILLKNLSDWWPTYTVERDRITNEMIPTANNTAGPYFMSLVHVLQMLSETNFQLAYCGCRGSDQDGTWILHRPSQIREMFTEFKIDKK